MEELRLMESGVPLLAVLMESAINPDVQSYEGVKQVRIDME